MAVNGTFDFSKPTQEIERIRAMIEERVNDVKVLEGIIILLKKCPPQEPSNGQQ